MVVEPGRMGYWRKFFRNSDIFEVIEKGILIAASDYPSEFHSRRGRIAEMLFSCRTTRCLGCSHVELHVPEEVEVGGEFRRDGEGVGSDCGGGKESKVDSSSGDAVGNYSYDEAEALTEEIEEESQTIAEVFRIKGVLASRNNESDSMLYESLRKLQLMRLSVETLQATEIGKTVNGLRKHNSKQIRHIVRTLIEEWKVLVDDWVAAAPVLEVEPTPESVNPSSFDDDMDGLPSPPLDEGAFLPTTSMEFSKFFDGMDDNGNPRPYEELNKKKEYRRGPAQEKHDNPERIKPLYSSSFGEDELQGRSDKQKSPQEARDTQLTLQVSAIKHGRPQEPLQKKQPNLNNGASRPAGSVTRRNSNLSHCFDNVKSNHQRGPVKVEKKSTALQDKPKNIDDNSVRAKLEMAKRKLQERYQEAENAKKQRTIQVMELHDLPKQGLGCKPFHPKQGIFDRNWQNGRH